MIEPRVYRAAFIPALLAVVLAMFSFQSRPRPLEQGLAADVLFDGEQAAALALQIAEDEPDRRPDLGPALTGTSSRTPQKPTPPQFDPEQEVTSGRFRHSLAEHAGPGRRRRDGYRRR